VKAALGDHARIIEQNSTQENNPGPENSNYVVLKHGYPNHAADLLTTSLGFQGLGLL
jgi:hypothetical protein